MRLRKVATTCHWLSLLLIDLISYGLTENYNKHQDFIRISSGPKKSLINTMMTKYSYPKNEVTAGVGYGHHLHPFYYQGEKKMMYPCAVECGEWETITGTGDSANDASSNIDVVTVHPDVASIDITTPKTRPAYKDASLLRSKNKYKSTTSFPPLITSPNALYNDYQDSKGADVQIISHKANSEYPDEHQGKKTNNGDKNAPESNYDGSLYGKYRNAFINGYQSGLSEYAGNKNNEYFDPVGESIRYNPPSFNEGKDDEDDENGEATAHRNNRDNKFHPKRERIEEKYVKHNLREERLEDLRTNSFGTSGENDDDYSTDESDGNYANNQSADDYEPQKYDVDDYAAPEEHSPSTVASPKPFKPSPPQGGKRNPPIRNGHRHEHSGGHYGPPRYQQYIGGYSDYDYGEEDRDKEPSVLRVNGAHFHPSSHSSLRQAHRIPNCEKNGPLAPRLPPNSQKGHQFRGRYQQGYPSSGYAGRNPQTSYYNSYYQKKKNSAHKNAVGPYPYHPYAPGHGYSPQSQGPSAPTRFVSSDGIRLVNPPRIPYKSHLPIHGRYPRYKNGLALPVQNPPLRIRGQKISYREIIPQRDGFTKVVKRYKTFVGHTPKRYV